MASEEQNVFPKSCMSMSSWKDIARYCTAVNRWRQEHILRTKKWGCPPVCISPVPSSTSIIFVRYRRAKGIGSISCWNRMKSHLALHFPLFCMPSPPLPPTSLLPPPLSPLPSPSCLPHTLRCLPAHSHTCGCTHSFPCSSCPFKSCVDLCGDISWHNKGK